MATPAERSDRTPDPARQAWQAGSVTIPAWLRDDERTRYVFHRDPRPGVVRDFPGWLADDTRAALRRTGIAHLWRHQAEVADAAFHGRHVAVSTGTASGKTLAYLLPILAATADGVIGFDQPERATALDLAGRGHSALYLAPTKALAHDQLRVCRELGLPNWYVGALDGDSSDAERRFARDQARYVLTNPDMIHRAVLPNHRRWTRLFSTLRYVVVDEAHRYRGVFGAHLSAVLRRLRRLAVWYGSDPVFIAASATVTDAGSLLAKLTGVEDVVEVPTDSSTAPPLDFALWQSDEDPHRDAAALMARLITEGFQTLCFTSSRVQAELVANRAAQAVDDPNAIASYRSGYLPWDRRDLERRLQSGSLRGVASTNALELGVDISGVDAVISCGFPGTRAALWQQAGRAGRADRDALAVLIARDDPLDAFWCDNPAALFTQPVEQTVLYPDNPRILAPHLAAAAQELPLTPDDSRFFGPETVALATQLADAGILRHRVTGWFWTRPDRAVDSIDLRTSSSVVVDIVDDSTGDVIGIAEGTTADRTLHEGAIYLHQGTQWRVTSYDPSQHVALVVPDHEPYYTQALGTSSIEISSVARSTTVGSVSVFAGDVVWSTQVTGYLRRDRATGTVWDSTDLSMPLRSMQTQATWWTLPDESLDTAEIPSRSRAGAVHAVEHTAIGMIAAFAPCDRWDVGGLSCVRHSDTGLLTVFVHDGHPGGAGFAHRGYDVAEQWLAATRARLDTCTCENGCPRCVVSPTCGRGNQPLDKAAARRMMTLISA